MSEQLNPFTGGLKKLYITPRDNVVKDFMIPVLKNSINYDRATGFFSSYSLIETSIGICDLVKRGGHIRILTSPRLRKDDVEAIKEGLNLQEIVDNAMVRDFELPDDGSSINRLALLSKLIAIGVLEIKVVVMRNIEKYPDAMFHAKFGLMFDANGNEISFIGSANETRNGLGGNWDHITVSTRNKDSVDDDELKEIFESLWMGNDEETMVLDLPEAISKMLKSCSSDCDLLELDNSLFEKESESVYFKCPDYIKVRDYQDKAIKKWVSCDYCGLYNMATGTGKTITALCSLERLYNDTGGGLYTVIVCPQKHLVDQWVDIVKEFDVMPIIGYSNSPTHDWKGLFKREVMRSMRKEFNGCLVVTINSFVSEDIQNSIKRIPNLVVVMDEVHNMGSALRVNALPNNAKYRIGLSATIDRFKDPVGTSLIRSYFGEECINFPLEDAIGTVLTNYRYYPIPCVMDAEEYGMFHDINDRIDAIMNDPGISPKRKIELVRPLKLQGARVIAGLHSKYDELEILGQKYSGDTHILVYCGKARWSGEDMDPESHEDCIKLVDRAVQVLGRYGVGLNVSKFTYKETTTERRKIKEDFTSGSTNALIAISCLDEGVDIPAIKTAIITSSSENPKEYIQRRGRVLRKFPGKEFAEIYDMIAIPVNLKEYNADNPSAKLELKHLAREMYRMEEFARLSLNREDTDRLVSEIEHSYSTPKGIIMQLYDNNAEE